MKHIINYILENKEIKHYVDAILVSEDDKVLLLRRANYMKKFPSYWGFTGGSIDKNDKNSKEAIIREVKEETGIELSFNEQQKMKVVNTKDHENKNGDIISDTEYWLIKLETTPDIKISKEHSKYEWVGPDEIKDQNRKFVPEVLNYLQLYFQGDINYETL